MPKIAETVVVYLEVLHESPTGVAVKDPNGFTRSFQKGKQPLDFDEDRQHVSITVDKKLWERRMRRAPEKAPRMERAAEPKELKRSRRCLNCGHQFHDHPSQRICQPCKSTATWKSGGDYSLAV